MIHDDDPLDLSIEELPTSAWAVQAPEGNSAVIRRSYKVSIYDKDYSPRGFEYFEAAEFSAEYPVSKRHRPAFIAAARILREEDGDQGSLYVDDEGYAEPLGVVRPFHSADKG